MTLDEVLDFLQTYVKLEEETSRQQLTQGEEYRAVRKQAARMWGDPANSVPYLPIYGDPTDADRHLLAHLQRRRIYRLSRYAHPALGEVVQCALSADSALWGPDGYHARYDVADRDGALKIVAEYQFCPGCLCTGETGAGACRECGGAGWKYVRGVKHPALGAPLEVRRLQAPTSPKTQAAHTLDR